MSPEQLVKHGEHQDEWGGYFIIKGKERLVRLLLGTRRNFPAAVKRNIWKNKDQYFSDIGIMIRCVKDDLTTIVCYIFIIILNYITDTNHILNNYNF